MNSTKIMYRVGSLLVLLVVVMNELLQNRNSGRIKGRIAKENKPNKYVSKQIKIIHIMFVHPCSLFPIYTRNSCDLCSGQTPIQFQTLLHSTTYLLSHGLRWHTERHNRETIHKQIYREKLVTSPSKAFARIRTKTINTF